MHHQSGQRWALLGVLLFAYVLSAPVVSYIGYRTEAIQYTAYRIPMAIIHFPLGILVRHCSPVAAIWALEWEFLNNTFGPVYSQHRP
jgi:hypothetical protein